MEDFAGDVIRLGKEIVGLIGEMIAHHGHVDHGVNNHIGNVQSLRPNSRARLSAKMRCEALVGENPTNRGMPREAPVLPVIIRAPSPAYTVCGANS